MTDRLGQDVGMEEGGVLAQLGASGASTDTEMVAGLSSPYHSSSSGKTDGVHNLGHSSSSVVLGDLACQDHSGSSLVAPDGLFSPDDHWSSDGFSELAHSPLLVEEAPQHELDLPPVRTFHKYMRRKQGVSPFMTESQ